jgi:hypothetical protein
VSNTLPRDFVSQLTINAENNLEGGKVMDLAIAMLRRILIRVQYLGTIGSNRISRCRTTGDKIVSNSKVVNFHSSSYLLAQKKLET